MELSTFQFKVTVFNANQKQVSRLNSIKEERELNKFENIVLNGAQKICDGLAKELQLAFVIGKTLSKPCTYSYCEECRNFFDARNKI